MMDILYIAWRYIAHNKIKSTTLVACISLIAFLPLALEVLLSETEQQFLSRSNTTPLLVGAKGSALDLTMSSLYFSDASPEFITMHALEEAANYNLANTIPIYARFHARDFPIIGTSIDYFNFRNLRPNSGRLFAVLGECVIGSRVAKELNVTVGDNLVSSPETAFDLAGVYPLKMKIVGVLNQSYTADDLAIFVDLKTAWVIQGLGHGHEDLEYIEDESVIIDRNEKGVIANAKVMQFNEITDSNITEFHFHGDLGKYPITSVALIPNDDKSSAILQGRYINEESSYQIVHPTTVIESLLENIFRIQNVINAIILFVGFATFLAIVLIFILSLRLRQKEIKTITYIGCNKSTVASLLFTEIFIIALISTFICGVLLFITKHFSYDLVSIFIV